MGKCIEAVASEGCGPQVVVGNAEMILFWVFIRSMERIWLGLDGEASRSLLLLICPVSLGGHVPPRDFTLFPDARSFLSWDLLSPKVLQISASLRLHHQGSACFTGLCSFPVLCFVTCLEFHLVSARFHCNTMPVFPLPTRSDPLPI